MRSERENTAEATWFGILFSTVMVTIMWYVAGCSTITDAASKIQWPKPQVIWTADNSTVTQSAPPPTTTTQPAAQKPTEGATSNADEAAQGFAHSAVIDCTLTFGSLNSSMWTYKLSPRSWEIKNDCQGEAWIARKINSKWVQKKYDHFRPNGTSRDFKNVHGGYQGNTVPASGETIALWFISYDHKRRSNAVFPQWR